MKTARPLALSLLLSFLCCAPALAQQGAAGRTTFREGSWYVVRTTPRTASGPVCTGFHMGQAGVQLGKDSLVVRFPAEIKSITLRYGDEPARPARPPEKAEQQMGGLVIAGADFERLRRSKSLGLDVTTAQGRQQHTLLLQGLDGALKNIEAGCPLPAAAARAERAASRARERVARERCSPERIARMRENGMPELRILTTCPKAAPASSPASAPR